MRQAFSHGPSNAPLMQWRNLLAVFLLVAATVAGYWPLVTGVGPMSQDHNVHLYRAFETEALLREGRFWGWSDAEYAGSPPFLTYHCGGDLLVSAVRNLTGAPLGVAYAWALLVAWLVIVLSVYVAARVQYGNAAGVLAGLLVGFDPGAWWIGGHESVMFVGLWETVVAAALVLCALALADGAAARGTCAAFVPIGVLVGVAVLMTPLSLVMLVAAAIPWLVAALSAIPRVSWRAAAKGTAIVALTAISISAFWLWPFLASRKYHDVAGLDPTSAFDLWKGVLEGLTMTGPAIWSGVALCGLLLMLARTDTFSRFLVLLIPVLLLLGTREVLHRIPHALDDPHFLSSLLFPRLFTLGRLACFVAAGFALATLGGAALTALHPWRRDWREHAWRGVALVVLGMLAATLVPYLTTVREDRHEPIPNALNPLRRKFLEQALDAAAPLVGTAHRIALYDATEGGYPTALMGPVALRGMKIHVYPQYAVSMFSNRVVSEDPQVLARLDTTVVLSHGAPPEPLRDLPLIGTYGEFELRRVTPTSRAWLTGEGKASVLEWTDSRIRVHVSGSSPGSHLNLMLGYFEGWIQADGAPIREFQMPMGTTGMARLSQVPARDGVLELVYANPAAVRGSLALTFVCFDILVIVLLVEWWRRRPKSVKG